MSASPMLNIGCGSHYHPDWVNLDVSPIDPKVMAVDINHGLPFSSGSIRVCYSSHVLEHLDKDGARRFVGECFRVLAPNGVIRLAVPDLEALTREYLRVLDALVSGDESYVSDYDWLMLELYDQTVRTSSGGEMSVFLNNLAEKNRAYVRTRIGVEAEQFWYPKTVEPVRLTNTRFLSMRIKRLREKLATWIVHLVAGKAAAQSFQLGLFRSGGEVHQWMYDRYSLARLLKHAGFGSIKICTAHESRIAKYEDYSLDVLNGAVRKPDSLYIEASKP